MWIVDSSEQPGEMGRQALAPEGVGIIVDLPWVGCDPSADFERVAQGRT